MTESSNLFRSVDAAPRRAHPRDVVVVSDDPAALRRVELDLGHFGHLIYSFTRVSAAIEHLATSPVDALLCDLRLIADGGGRIIRAARANRRAVRAFGMTDDPLALLSTEAPTQFDRLLLKPVDCAELHRLILAGSASD